MIWQKTQLIVNFYFSFIDCGKPFKQWGKIVFIQRQFPKFRAIKFCIIFLCYINGNPLQYSCLENPIEEEPGRLQSTGSLRVGQDWATSLSLFTFMPWRRKWQPTPVFLPGESQGRGSLVGCRLWGRTELYGVEQSWTRLKRLSSSSSRTVKVSLIAQLVKNLPAMQETLVRFLKICRRRDRLPTPVFFKPMWLCTDG